MQHRIGRVLFFQKTSNLNLGMSHNSMNHRLNFLLKFTHWVWRCFSFMPNVSSYYYTFFFYFFFLPKIRTAYVRLFFPYLLVLFWQYILPTCCSELTGQQLSAYGIFIHSSWNGVGKRTGGVKDSLDKDSLISERGKEDKIKTQQKPSDIKAITYHLHQKTHTKSVSGSSVKTAPLELVLSMTWQSMEYPYLGMYWSVWISRPSYVSSPLHPTTTRAEWAAEKTWMLCKCSSATAETTACCQCCFGHQHKTQDNLGCYEEN